MTPRTLRLLTVPLAALGFAGSTACVLGPGSRAPRTAPPPPAHGPAFERGGQRLRAPVPAEARAAAENALRDLGWTVQPSERPEEALGILHDNLAVLRWSADGWWAQVTQRSRFAPPHVQVPTWDHPWEALRLLHRAAPGAGPAEGWRALEPLPEPLAGESAEALYRQALLDVAAGRALAPDAILRLREHVLRVPEPALQRARLGWLMRRWPREPARWYWPPAGVRPLVEHGITTIVLQRCVDERRDPFTVLSPLTRFAGDARPAPQPASGESILFILANARAVRQDEPPWLTQDVVVALRHLGPPDADLLPDLLRRSADAKPWWTDRVLPWLDALAQEAP